MPWCPKCRTEYRDGFITCSGCNVELVNELEQIEEITYDTEVFLMSVANDIDADIYKSLLNSYEIPVRRRYKGAGDYIEVYMGATNLGIDLYVPSKLLEQAKEIIDNESQEMNETLDVEDIPVELEKKYKFKQRFRAWIILLIFIPGLLGIIFMFLMVILQMFNG